MSTDKSRRCECGAPVDRRAIKCRKCYEWSKNEAQPWTFDTNTWLEIRAKKEAELVGGPMPQTWDRANEAEDAISPWLD